MRDLIELLRVIVWPLTTLIVVLVLRAELRRFAQNVADRIESAHSVTIGPSGIRLSGIIKAPRLPAGLQRRKENLSRDIRAISNKPRLDTLAEKLNVPISSDVRAQRNGILLEINRRVQTDEDFDRLSASLKGLTGRDC